MVLKRPREIRFLCQLKVSIKYSNIICLLLTYFVTSIIMPDPRYVSCVVNDVGFLSDISWP